MELFPVCDKCWICSSGDGCIAGDGDDYYSPASKKQVINRLDKGWYPVHEKEMKQYLLERFNYTYKPLSWRIRHCKIKQINVRVKSDTNHLTEEMKEFYSKYLTEEMKEFYSKYLTTIEE